MKVLYDISILGLGHIIPRARTGIFRVTESVAEHLVERNDCELVFCCENDEQTTKNVLQYLHASKMSHVPFSISPQFSYLRANHNRHVLIDDIVKNKIDDPIGKISSRIKIRGLWLEEKILRRNRNTSRHLVNPGDFKNADIYHSPIYPIPIEFSRSNKAVFLTCYDLIPLLYPQYCEQDIIDLISNVVATIDHNTWVLCISNATRNDLLNFLGNKVNAERVIVTELAASAKFYESKDKEYNQTVKKKYGIPEQPYVLSLCTLEPRKNIDHVIRAFIRLVEQEHIKDLNLVLVGSKGWMFDKIFNEIDAHSKIKDRIIITGFVPDEDLAAVYSDALLFVYPSFYEGFGLPPLEAMQCGVPVITSNTSSLPEVVGNAGILMAPTDLDGLCQHMLNIYSDPFLQEEMKKKSLERSKLFSWERCADETVQAYKKSVAAVHLSS